MKVQLDMEKAIDSMALDMDSRSRYLTAIKQLVVYARVENILNDLADQ